MVVGRLVDGRSRPNSLKFEGKEINSFVACVPVMGAPAKLSSSTEYHSIKTGFWPSIKAQFLLL